MRYVPEQILGWGGEGDQENKLGAFKGGRYNESSVQKNKEEGGFGPSRYGHGQTFGSDNGGTLTKGLINLFSLGHPGGGRRVGKRLM